MPSAVRFLHRVYDGDIDHHSFYVHGYTYDGNHCHRLEHDGNHVYYHNDVPKVQWS